MRRFVIKWVRSTALKTVVRKGLVGSSPTPSATFDLQFSNGYTIALSRRTAPLTFL